MRKILMALALALVTSGCALTTDSIDVPYERGTDAAPAVVPGASNAAVRVSATDGRTTYRDRVSSKKNGFGMEMAAITATNDIPQSVGDAVKAELAARGFNLGPGGADVTVEVLKFYNDFKNGFFAGDAVADVALQVTVLRPDKSIAYAKYYDASGTEPNIQLAVGSNARRALIIAFRNAVNSVVNDGEFLQAVLAAQPASGRPAAINDALPPSDTRAAASERGAGSATLAPDVFDGVYLARSTEIISTSPTSGISCGIGDTVTIAVKEGTVTYSSQRRGTSSPAPLAEDGHFAIVVASPSSPVRNARVRIDGQISPDRTVKGTVTSYACTVAFTGDRR